VVLPSVIAQTLAKMVPSMLELIFFYILEKIIQGYNSHFLCARVMVFSGALQQNFAGAGLLCTGMTFDLKNDVPAKFMMQSCKFFPPQWRRQKVVDAATITARLLP
jgi:hypothetical protein